MAAPVIFRVCAFVFGAWYGLTVLGAFLLPARPARNHPPTWADQSREDPP